MILARSIVFSLACMAYILAPIIAIAPDDFTLRNWFWLIWGCAPMTILLATADYRYGIVGKPCNK